MLKVTHQHNFSFMFRSVGNSYLTNFIICVISQFSGIVQSHPPPPLGQFPITFIITIKPLSCFHCLGGK